MELRIHARNIQLDPQADDYIQKIFTRLQRHLRSILDAILELSGTSSRSRIHRVVAQMTLVVKGHVLRGQERGVNLYAAIDAVADVMDRQIAHYKGKVYSNEQARRAGKVAQVGGLDPVADDSEQGQVVTDIHKASTVVRTSQFPMKPMTVLDAIYNAAYRRFDGNYGVTQPELS